MCGRFTLTKPDLMMVAEAAQAQLDERWRQLYHPRYNIAPTQQHWIIQTSPTGMQLIPAIWGVVPRGTFLINARIETILQRTSSLKSFLERRCLIPADGFYEWQSNGKQRRPFWFHASDRSLLWFAGIADDVEDSEFPHFRIVTTAANVFVATYHNRMPLMIAPAAFPKWRNAPEQLLERLPYLELAAVPVSGRVNNVANDDAACIAPPAADDAENQLGLFLM